MLRVVLSVVCLSLVACADFSYQHRLHAALAGVAKEVEALCPTFARASKVPLGSDADMAAIRKALVDYQAGDVAEIRWISVSHVAVATVKSLYVKPGPLQSPPRFGNLGTSTYCCELHRHSGGRWVVTKVQMLTIA